MILTRNALIVDSRSLTVLLPEMNHRLLLLFTSALLLNASLLSLRAQTDVSNAGNDEVRKVMETFTGRGVHARQYAAHRRRRTR